MIFVDGGNDRVVIGGSNVTAVSTFAVTYPQAKTDTSTRYVHAWQSNEASGQSQLRIQAIGHADTQASRTWQLQSSESGVANGGTIQFQPDGGTVAVTGVLDLIGTTDASDASGDTGILRVEGGASIAKKLYVGTDLDVDGTSNLDVVDIDGAVDMASTLQVDGAITSSAGATITTADNTDTLTLTSTDADANSGPNLRLYRNSASPADSDDLGRIEFEGRNDNSQDYVAVQIHTNTGDVSDGNEKAQIMFDVMSDLSLIHI